MNKMKGLIDPISLGFVLMFGFTAAVGIASGALSDDKQQLAQETVTPSTATTEVANQYLADN